MRKTSIFPALLAASALAATAATAAAPRPRADSTLYWYYYDIDTVSAHGESSPAFDADGKLKVGYRSTYFANYAAFDGTFWKTEVADTNFMAGNAQVAMALDPQGNPHMIKQDYAYSTIFYVKKEAGKWSFRKIESTGIPNLDFYEMDIRVDAKNGVHMMYPKSLNGYATVTYSYLDPQGTLSQPAYPAKGLSGKWGSMTLDASDKPAMAYYYTTGSELGLTYMDGADLKHILIDSNGYETETGYFASIQHEKAGKFYICHQDRTKKLLVLTYGTPGGTWKTERVDTIPGTIPLVKSSLGLDLQGRPYVAYCLRETKGDSVTASRLMLAYKPDSAWRRVTVDSTDWSGSKAAIAMSPAGLPAITYFADQKKALRAAIASYTPPADTNHNGIPDYKEVKPSAVRKRANHRGPGAGTELFDTRGKKIRPPAGGNPGSGKILFRKPSPAAPREK